MISICLRRPEFIPRAYQIFKQMLEDVKIGGQPMPDVDTWARILEGVTSLGKEGGKNAEAWRSRSMRLIEQWEEYAGGGVAEETPEECLKVYQGWFAGLVR